MGPSPRGPTRNNNNTNKNKRSGRNLASSLMPIAIETGPLGGTRPQSVHQGRDLIATLVTSAASPFTVSGSYSINPGTLFPSLSLEAKRWDRYRFRSLSFTIEPSTGVSTTPGTTWMMWDPNGSTAAPSSMTTVSASEHRATGPVWRPHTLTIKPAKLAAWRYTRYGAASPILFYDTGQLHVGTQGMSSSVTFFVHAHYVIEFSDYQLGASESFQLPATINGLRDVAEARIGFQNLDYPLYQPCPSTSRCKMATISTLSGQARVADDYLYVPPGSYLLICEWNPELKNITTAGSLISQLTIECISTLTGAEVSTYVTAAPPGLPVTPPTIVDDSRTQHTTRTLYSDVPFKVSIDLVFDSYNHSAIANEVRVYGVLILKPLVV